MRFQPEAVRIAPFRLRTGGADIRHRRAGFHQQPRDQQFRAFIAGNGDPRGDWRSIQRGANRRQEFGFRRVDVVGRHVRRLADGGQPGVGALDTDGTGTDDRTAGGQHLADRCGIERMNRADDGAIQRAIQVAPFARRHLRSDSQPHRRQQRADSDRIDREQFANQSHCRKISLRPRTQHRTGLGFQARVTQHRAGQHILRLRVSRHAEAGNVDANDADAVDDFRQPIQRHARSGRDAQIDHDDRVVVRRLRGFVHRVADVLVKLPAHQRFRVERHIADRPLRAIEVRGERQAVNATGGTGQDRRRAAHTQADAQRPEGRAHRLRLIVRTARIVFHQLVKRFALARSACRFNHRFTAAVTA